MQNIEQHYLVTGRNPQRCQDHSNDQNLQTLEVSGIQKSESRLLRQRDRFSVGYFASEPVETASELAASSPPRELRYRKYSRAGMPGGKFRVGLKVLCEVTPNKLAIISPGRISDGRPVRTPVT